MNIPSSGVFFTTSAVLSTLYLLAKHPEASQGPRMCIDVPFAMASMKVALATMLSHTHIDLDPAQA
jgi:cytochrome P450